MTFQTRTIERRTGTHWGDDRSHINRITLGAEPWAEPELKPELKPEHQRPAPGRFAPISVRTPTVAKVEDEQPDRFAEWEEDFLADEWKDLCRDEGHIAKPPASVARQREAAKLGAAKRLPQTSRIMVDLLERLRHGDIRRSKLFDSNLGGNVAVHRRRAFEMGWIKGGSQPDALISLTAAGYKALAAMRGETA